MKSLPRAVCVCVCVQCCVVDLRSGRAKLVQFHFHRWCHRFLPFTSYSHYPHIDSLTGHPLRMRIAVLVAMFCSTTSLPTSSPHSESDESFEDDDDSWECGTDSFSKYLSENQIEMDCPKIKKTVNQCCIVHDKCYDDQLGRKHCDDAFCDCLDRVTRDYEVCNKEDGPLFCGMVRQFGAEPYLRAGNHTSTVVLEESQDDLTRTTNITTIETAANHDYDYETIVRLNDTAAESSLREGTDLLETLLRSA